MAEDIVDPHHHLWARDDIGDYLLADLHADTATVPGVVQTVFVECGASYRAEGPEHLRPVGETEFVAAIAAASESAPGPTIAGIVAHADLTLDPDRLDEVLDAHDAASGGRFRGIRDALCRAPEGVQLGIPGRAAAGKAGDPDFQRGAARLGERGLTYDTWQYHVQLGELVELARAVPGTTVVLDHFSTPLGVGPWEGRHDEVFEAWAPGIAEAAACPNVVAKLGGMAMPDNGFGWHLDPSARPDIEAFLAVQARWYHHTIEHFGPDRCMFESNFPVDRWSVDYATYWGAMDVIAERYEPHERAAMFAGTARRVYRLPTP
ncbi:MAG TPA: amidohydrolase family protein [Acidimicrobiales bacterium]|nr:amidohydrolase family protein [Acidimicrobiales bacterium]